MSLIANMSGAPAYRFKNMGDCAAGRIISFEDFQCTEFADDAKRGVKKGDLRFWELKPGDDPANPRPIMGIRIVIEAVPGDASTQVSLWCEKPRQLKAIAAAVKSTGASDLEAGGDLALTFSAYDGRAQAFTAAYMRPEVEMPPTPEAPQDDPWADA